MSTILVLLNGSSLWQEYNATILVDKSNNALNIKRSGYLIFPGAVKAKGNSIGTDSNRLARVSTTNTDIKAVLHGNFVTNPPDVTYIRCNPAFLHDRKLSTYRYKNN